MRENTQLALRAALTHLRVQQQEIETALAAVQAVLGEGDLVPVRDELHEATAPRPAARARQVLPTRRQGRRAEKGTRRRATAARAASKRSSRAAAKGATDAATAIVGYLTAHGPSQPKTIRTGLGLSARVCKVALEQLVTGKRIAGEGATISRRYHLVAPKPSAPPSKPPDVPEEYVTAWNGASRRPLTAANGGGVA